MSNQVLTIVGPNGQQAIRREWERVQVKSHQINTTILKVDMANILRLVISFSSYSDRTTITKLHYRLVHLRQRERTAIQRTE